VAITGLRAIAAEEGFLVPSDRWGKWKTAMQMVGLVGLLLHFEVEVDFGLLSGSVHFHRVGLTLLCLSMVFSVGSAVGYLTGFVNQSLRSYSERKPRGD
jgi:CDP-diacylglycerol--glycerol-3-phosphate 3-phosphatidyltransferase